MRIAAISLPELRVEVVRAEQARRTRTDASSDSASSRWLSSVAIRALTASFWPRSFWPQHQARSVVSTAQQNLAPHPADEIRLTQGDLSSATVRRAPARIPRQKGRRTASRDVRTRARRHHPASVTHGLHALLGRSRRVGRVAFTPRPFRSAGPCRPSAVRARHLHPSSRPSNGERRRDRGPDPAPR